MFLVFLLFTVTLMLTFRFTEGFDISNNDISNNNIRSSKLIANYNEIGKVLTSYDLMSANFKI